MTKPFRLIEDAQAPAPVVEPLYDSRVINGMLKSPEGWGKILDPKVNGDLETQLAGSRNPVLDRKVIANKAMLADRMQLEPDEVESNYEMHRNEFGRQILKLSDGDLTDEGFYSAAGKLVEREENEIALIQETVDKTFPAQISGQSFSEFYAAREQEMKQHPGFTSDKRDFFRMQSKEIWDRFLNFKSTHFEDIKAVEGFFVAQDLDQKFSPIDPEKKKEAERKMRGRPGKPGQAPEAFEISPFPEITEGPRAQAHREQVKRLKDEAIATLEKLDPQARSMIIEIAAQNQANAQKGDQQDRTYLQKFMTRAGRGAKTFGEELVTGASRAIKGDVFRAQENQTQGSNRADLARSLEDRFRGQVDPARAQGWLTEGLLAAAESLPQTAVAFTPPGLVLMGVAAQTQMRRQFNEAGVTGPAAELLSLVGSIPYAGIEYVEANMIFAGKIPGVTAVMDKLKDYGKKGLLKLGTQTAIRFAGQSVGQLSQEIAQDLVQPGVQSFASLVSEAIPEVQWMGEDGEFAKIKEAIPETAAALLPLVLLGTGTASMRDASIGVEYIRNRRALSAAGFSPAQVNELVTAAPEIVKAELQRLWSKREGVGSPEQREALEQMNAEQRETGLAVSGPQTLGLEAEGVDLEPISDLELLRTAEGNDLNDLRKTNPKGLTQLAYRIGLNTRTVDEVHQLRVLAGNAKAETDRKMRVAEAMNDDALMQEAINEDKGQYFQEAYDKATNSGSARDETSIYPDSVSPFILGETGQIIPNPDFDPATPKIPQPRVAPPVDPMTLGGETIDIEPAEITVSDPVDVSDTFKEGTSQIKLTDPKTGGAMEIVIHPDKAPSVLSLFVPEESRGTGSGKRLLAKALELYPDLQGQIQNKAAAVNAYKAGRRPVGLPNATLEETLAIIDEESSVNMQTPAAQPELRLDAPAGGPDVIRDEDGQPIPFYHATDAQFDRFEKTSDIGFHFGTKEQAGYKKRSRLIEARLNIRNPLRLPDHSWGDAGQMRSALAKVGIKSPELDALADEFAKEEKADNWRSPKARELTKAALAEGKRLIQEAGFDAVVYKNEVEGQGDSFIVFSDDQIIRLTPEEQTDAEYQRAVDSGDVETQQRLVDEAGEAAGLTRYNHGTTRQFDSFKLPDPKQTTVARMGPGIYGAVPSDTQTAKVYSTGEGGRVLPLFISTKGFLENGEMTEAQFEAALSVLDPSEILADGNQASVFIDRERAGDERTLNSLWGLFQTLGGDKWYEAMAAAGIKGAVHTSAGIKNGEVVVFDLSLIQSAEPVVRDASGNVIPLSQRFGQAQPDPQTQAEASPKYGVTRSEEGDFIVTAPDGTEIGRTSTGWAAARLMDEHKAQTAAEEFEVGSVDANDRAGTFANQWTPNQPNSARAQMTPTPEAARRPVSNAPQVIKAFEKIMKAIGEQGRGLFRVGRGKSLKTSALGFYHPSYGIIRLRTANDIEVAAHEVAHFLDDMLWAFRDAAGNFKQGSITGPNSSHWQTTVGPAEAKELFNLGKALYGDRVAAGSYWNEGFSEFIRLFMTDPDLGQKLAPKFYDWFQTDVLGKNPELREAVLEGQRLGVQFYSQGALARMRAGIAEVPGLTEAIKETAEEFLANARKNWLDTTHGLQEIVKAANIQRAKRGRDPVADNINPALTASARALTADSTVAHMAEEGMLDFAGNKTGESLAAAFAVARQGGTGDDFVLYLWANRAIRLWRDPKHGPRNPGITLADANFVKGTLENHHFSKAAQMVYDWNDGVLEYAAQASPEFRDIVETIRDADPGAYIPLYREFGALDAAYAGKANAGGGALIQRLRGSGRRIKNPVESMLVHAKNIVLKANQKHVVDQIFKIVDTTPGIGLLVQKVDIGQVKTRVPQWQIFEGLKKKLMNAKTRDIQTRLKELQDDITAGAFTKEEADARYAALKQEFKDYDPAETVDPIEAMIWQEGAFDFFIPNERPKQNEWPLFPRKNKQTGKTDWYEMRPDVFDALRGMDGFRFGKALDLIVGLPARMTRLGTTGLRASFSLITNPLRDFRTLHVNSQASANSVQLFGLWLSSMKDSLMLSISRPDLASEWGRTIDRLGIRMANMLHQDSRPLARAGRRIKNGKKFKTLDIRDHFDLLRELLQFPETAARMAEVKAVAKDMGWNPSQPLTPAIAHRLTLAGKQVTTDFTSAGRMARVYNSAVPFFNAGIQGPRANIRALRRDPIKFMARGLQGTALALSLWWMNKDEEWWIDMDDNERYLWTFIPIPGTDELLRLPRAFEVDGLFMASAVAMADAAYQQDPAMMTGWFGEFFQNITQLQMADGVPVPPMPVLAELALEQAANRNFFFDSPLVPESERGDFAEEQYSAFTTNAAIQVGQIFGISPRRFEHAVGAVFGPVGKDVLALTGRGGKAPFPLSQDDFELADTFVLGVLFQRGGQVARSSKSIDALYDAAGHARKVQRRDRENESDDHREMRLMLDDATKVQATISLLEREAGSQEERRRLRGLRVAVARSAVRMAKSGEINRDLALRISDAALREADSMQEEE